jgi:hypothetical protein
MLGGTEMLETEMTYISAILEACENKSFVLSELDDRVCFLGGSGERLVDDDYVNR